MCIAIASILKQNNWLIVKLISFLQCDMYSFQLCFFGGEFPSSGDVFIFADWIHVLSENKKKQFVNILYVSFPDIWFHFITYLFSVCRENLLNVMKRDIHTWHQGVGRTCQYKNTNRRDIKTLDCKRHVHCAYMSLCMNAKQTLFGVQKHQMYHKKCKHFAI